MKKIIQYLQTFIKEDFHLGFYFYTLLFLSTFIYFNYNFNLEYNWVLKYFGTYKAYFLGFTFNACAYYFIAIPKAIFFKEKYLSKNEFWIKSSLFLFLLSLDGGFYLHGNVIAQQTQWSTEERKYMWIVVNNIYPTVLYIIPLLFIKFAFDRKEKNLYGLTTKNFDFYLYAILLLLMFPLLFWASFQPDFLQSYPVFKPWQYDQVFGFSKTVMTSFFEFVYGLDFVSVELLFRGAMIIGLASVMGRHSILPMVSVYAFLHFGKPLAETIGSIFGGYILGVLALNTRTILGGCAIHMGVALAMEILALFQYYFLHAK